MDAGRSSPFAYSQNPAAQQGISGAQREAAASPYGSSIFISPNQSAQYSTQAPAFAQNALTQMASQLRGLPIQSQQAAPMQQSWNPFMNGFPAQQQPEWMQQRQQAQQSFQQSPAFQDYQNRMRALQDEFQGSDTYKNFQQQEQSFQPQIQQWQQQQMQRQFSPMYGAFGGGFPGYGGYGGYPGMGGGLAGLMGGFGFYR